MKRELEVAIEAALRAGKRVREIQDSDAWTTTQKDQGKGPLTEADLEANALLFETIQASFPADAILSEESKDNPSRLENRRCWIIDPVDGTREFTLRIPEYCVSVGFVLDHQAVVGALYNPATEELIAGAQGLGVTYDGQAAQTTDHAEIAGARFLVSRSEHGKGWFAPWEDRADLTPMGSVAWKLGLVAVGKAEATFTPKPRNAWDLCAGVACLRAAGGRATDGSGQDYSFNEANPLKIGVCGSNGALHERVLEMMNALG